MSQENVEIVRSAYEHFQATGNLQLEFMAPEIVWDMSKYAGWVERTVYHGVDGAHELVEDWTEVWDEWHVELDALLDAGDRVVVIIQQRSRSQFSQRPVNRSLAQVWTMREGKVVRMDGYSTPGDALRACGLTA